MIRPPLSSLFRSLCTLWEPPTSPEPHDPEVPAPDPRMESHQRRKTLLGLAVAWAGMVGVPRLRAQGPVLQRPCWPEETPPAALKA